MGIGYRQIVEACKRMASLASAGTITGDEIITVERDGVRLRTTTSTLGGGDGGAVLSVNGETGTVVIDYDDLDGTPTLGSAAAADVSDFATAAQGEKADSALQADDGLAALDSSAASKLDGIAEGAEVNVQSDWNASSGDAFIANKPTLGTAAAQNTTAFDPAGAAAAAQAAAEATALAAVDAASISPVVAYTGQSQTTRPWPEGHSGLWSNLSGDGEFPLHAEVGDLAAIRAAVD